MKILLILLFLNSGGHKCKWKLCPYKGIKKSEYASKVKEYINCSTCCDAFQVDITHLYRPTWSYDKIHYKLFKQH